MGISKKISANKAKRAIEDNGMYQEMIKDLVRLAMISARAIAALEEGKEFSKMTILKNSFNDVFTHFEVDPSKLDLDAVQAEVKEYDEQTKEA